MLQNAQYFQTQASDGASESGTLIDGNQGAAAASFTTAGFYIGNVRGFSAVLSCPSTGSPVGTVTLQVCSDLPRGPNKTKPDTGLVNWVDYACRDAATDTVITDQDVNGASAIMFEVVDCMARFARLKYTRTSGSITAKMICQFKGWA